LSYIDWSQFQPLLLEANGIWLLLVFLLIHIDRIMMAFKWSILFRSSPNQVSVKDAIVAYYVGGFWGTFLPTTIGGDAVRIAWLNRKESATTMGILSSIVVERAFGAFALALSALAAFFFFAKNLRAQEWLLSAMILALLCVSGIAILALFSTWLHRMAQKIGNRIRSQFIADRLERFRQAIWLFRSESKILWLFFILSLIEQIFPIIANYMLAKAFSIELPLAWAFMGIPIILAVSRLPISVNSLGIQEGMYAFVFSFAGVPVTASVFIAIMARALVLLSVLPGALYPWRASGATKLALTTQDQV
jgi:uncharacterized protein (TIRG00374 family)